MGGRKSTTPGGGAGEADAAEDGDDRGGGGEEAGEAGEAGDGHQGDEEDPGGGAEQEDRKDTVGAVVAGRLRKPLVDQVAPPEQEGEADPAGGQGGGEGPAQNGEAVKGLDATGAGGFAALKRIAGAEDVGDEPGEGDEDRDQDRRGAQARVALARVEGPERQEGPAFGAQQRRRRA